MIVVLLLFALSILIETVFYTFPFTLLTVILMVLSQDRENFTLIFLSGLFLDLFAFRPLGVDSLIFLLLAAFIMRYNRRIYFSNILYVIIFVLLAVSSYSFIFYRKLISVNDLILTVVLSLLLLYTHPFIVSGTTGRKKLQV